jgi:hypothetical protein
MYLKSLLELPSSVSWCERKYFKSEYIAEYWNTLTGIFLCVTSIYAYFKNHGFTKLYYSNILLFFVGIGTMMFHGTLVYFWQLLDEIPMMLIVIEYYRILTTELLLIYYIQIYTINYSIIYLFIPIIFASYYIHPKLQVILFQGGLSLSIILLLYTCYHINTNLNKIFYKINPFNYVDIHESKIDDHRNTELEIKYKKKTISRKIHVFNNYDLVDTTNSLNKFKKYVAIKNNITYHSYQGIYSLVFSLFVWNIDNHYCQHYIELHAIWHITTSLGMYSCNELLRSYIILNKQLVQK